VAEPALAVVEPEPEAEIEVEPAAAEPGFTVLESQAVVVEPEPAISVVEPEPDFSVVEPIVELAPTEASVTEEPVTKPSLVEQFEALEEEELETVAPETPEPSPSEGAGTWVITEAVEETVTAEAAQAVAEPEAVEAAPATEPALDEEIAAAFSFDETAEAVEEAPAVDQAEMRRRIEDTRARLKAKAFDAMTSGGSALLSQDEGELGGAAGSEVAQLDEEVTQAIDESLSQEDA